MSFESHGPAAPDVPEPARAGVPALSHSDYAAFAKQGDAQLLACCEVETFHASGPGGQGVNTADSAVRMRHLPTGIVVTARSERSQLLNRQACLAKLRAELTRRSRPPKPRVKTKVPHRSRERRLQAKHQVSEKKTLRARVREDD
jgi:protein subunit release factor B